MKELLKRLSQYLVGAIAIVAVYFIMSTLPEPTKDLIKTEETILGCPQEIKQIEIPEKIKSSIRVIAAAQWPNSGIMQRVIISNETQAYKDFQHFNWNKVVPIEIRKEFSGRVENSWRKEWKVRLKILSHLQEEYLRGK